MINWHAQKIAELGNGGMFEVSIDPVVPWVNKTPFPLNSLVD